MVTPASIPADLAQKAEQAAKKIAAGALSLVELFQLTDALNRHGRHETSIQLYRSWLATPSPLAYAANFNLAILLNARGDLGGAEAAYRNAVAQNPRFCEGILNLGTLLEKTHRPQEAVDTWRLVDSFADPANPADRAFLVQSLNNQGRLLEIQRDFPAAEEALTRSLHLNPDQDDVITHWVHLRQKQCRWPVFSTSASGVPEARLMNAASALGMLSGSGDPAIQLAAAQRFIRDKIKTDLPQLSSPAGYQHSRLRIGYLSSDFCAHAVSILTAELYGLHDRARVEVFGFDWSKDDGTPLRARVLAGFDQHVRIHELTDEEAARLIRSHEIDILVDLHGLTSGARPTILSYRPAPVQVTWLGLPGTTAHPHIDYVIADPFVLPPELEPYFTEKPLHLPRTFQINDRQRAIGPTPSRAANNLPQEAFVFCAFNNCYKITEEMFGAWMRILRRVPHSVLWVMADHAEMRVNLGRQAELAGVAAERLVFAGRAQPADYLARFQIADLFLDSNPFNGGTTASDALWAGLPLLTYAGRTFSSRMAGSLLRAVDLPELVTFSVAEYEERAVALAQQPAQLAALKDRLRADRLQSALFDTPAFVRDLEDAYERVALGSRVAHAGPAEAARSALPLVAVLMPVADTPAQTLQSLHSALEQSYANVEIIVSDASAGDATASLLAPLLAQHLRIRYWRAPGLDPVANQRNAYKLAQAPFVCFLMAGEMQHPQKLQQMMSYALSQANVGMVSAYCQPLGSDGNFAAADAGPLYRQETRIGGTSLGDMMLSSNQNIIGGAAGVMFSKLVAGPRYGEFLGREYQHLPLVASWLAVLQRTDCVYLPHALSFVPPAPPPAAAPIGETLEWLQLLCDAHEQGVYQTQRQQLHPLLASKLVTAQLQLAAAHEEIKRGAYELERIHALIRQANTILLAP
jgi:predicted O-linked N-acetylglucosamine transferase (SPINDLY family)